MDRMKNSIFTLVGIALFALVFTACDNVAPETTPAPATDSVATVCVDTCAAATTTCTTATVVATSTVK